MALAQPLSVITRLSSRLLTTHINIIFVHTPSVSVKHAISSKNALSERAEQEMYPHMVKNPSRVVINHDTDHFFSIIDLNKHSSRRITAV